MKLICISLVCGVILLSCNPNPVPIVNKQFIDSLLTHYTPPSLAKSNELEMQFWKNKMDQENPGGLNEQKYANALLMRFHLFGDIRDLTRADSLISELNERFGMAETGITLTLADYCMLKLKFNEARKWVQLAKMRSQVTVDKKEVLLALEFDLYFESGKYDSAAGILSALRAKAGYSYYFRLSRMEDLKGSPDSAISDMLRAADLAKTNDYLKQLALSNAASLYVQKGDWQKANDLYMTCIYLNPTDFHSIMGLGWIALMGDQDDSLSTRIFQFVQTQFKAPDPLFKLNQVEEAKQDEVAEKKYALGFATRAADPAYGNMYNKYLIDLYTGILDDPASAEAIAEKETGNRPSPQTFARYAWALLKNNKKDRAMQVYEAYVAGKPLEAVELYWMGKLLKTMHKDNDAAQFFESARKKRFDLSPGKLKDLEKNLE